MPSSDVETIKKHKKSKKNKQPKEEEVEEQAPVEAEPVVEAVEETNGHEESPVSEFPKKIFFFLVLWNFLGVKTSDKFQKPTWLSKEKYGIHIPCGTKIYRHWVKIFRK